MSFPSSQMVLVTVNANKRLSREVNGGVVVYLGGDTVYVPANEAVYLRRDGLVT